MPCIPSILAEAAQHTNGNGEADGIDDMIPEDVRKRVLEFVDFLGMDPADKDLYWIALLCSEAPLPPGWVEESVLTFKCANHHRSSLQDGRRRSPLLRQQNNRGILMGESP